MSIKVLSIEDDKIVQTVIKKTLDAEYEVLSAKDAQSGIDLARETSPDLILLDVEMPGLDGYEACRVLKSEQNTAAIPIMFISSRGNLDSRLSGYEAGAEDFLVKPFEPSELKAKVNLLGKLRQKQDNLSQQVKAASETALTAMRSANLYGMTIGFVEQCIRANNYKDLISALFEILNSIGVSASLMIKGQGDYTFCDSNSGTISPLQEEVMKKIHQNNQRIFDFGHRTQLNFPHIALLVKNMPVSDNQSYGLIKDALPNMLAVANEKVISISGEQAMATHTRNLTESFDAVEITLTSIAESLEENQKNVVDIFQSLMEQLEKRIPGMGLEDDQEAYLMETFENALIAAQQLVDKSEETRNAFNMVNRLLQHLASKQRELLDHFEHKLS